MAEGSPLLKDLTDSYFGVIIVKTLRADVAVPLEIFSARISTGTQAILIQVLRGFPESVQTNAGVATLRTKTASFQIL
jgi:hypothetical protein